MNKQKKAFRELDTTISQMLRVVEVGDVELVRDDRFRSALRELQKSRKGGQIQSERLVRAIALICEIACDKYLIGGSGDDQEDEEQGWSGN